MNWTLMLTAITRSAVNINTMKKKAEIVFQVSKQIVIEVKIHVTYEHDLKL
jgi:hypothetical protein